MADRPFRDRRDAGRQLAERVRALDLHEPIVLGLPRGGVPVAFEVARALGAPLEVFVARKLGAPGQPELGIGAIAEGGGRFVDAAAVAALGVSDDQLDRRETDEGRELVRRVAFYRQGRPLPVLEGRDVVLVDDGLATGVTARAALDALRAHRPGRLVLAVPVGARQSVDSLAGEGTTVVCVLATDHLAAVGLWYDEFDPTSDEEVIQLLDGATVREVDRREVQRLVAGGAQLVDVMPAAEWAESHITGAVHIPLKELDTLAPGRLDRVRPVIVYCYDSL